MMKVANQKVIHRLTIKSLGANRTRNIIAIIAIALTTILFATLFTISVGLVETVETETMRQAGGSAHASLKYLSDEEYEKVKDHPLIKEAGYNVLVGMAGNKEFLKRHTEIWYSDEKAAEMCFITPTTGRMPESDNEIVAGTKTLDLLGVPRELGQKVTLEYTINGEKRSREFIISGFYESDAVSRADIVLVSRAFIAKELKGVTQNYREDYDAAGTIRLDIMFANSMNIEGKIRQVIADSGFSVNEGDDNYLAYGVNWSYMSTNLGADAETVAGTLLAAMLIIFTGYLIIYNIFQISVIKDIRFYGLLKTIGITPNQLKSMIMRQAFLLSIIGIPIGLVTGYLLGVVLLPLVVSVSAYSGHASVSASPYIFLGAAAFSLTTVSLSCRRPGRIAAKVSPVEAVRFTGINSNPKRAVKKSVNGAKLYKMALANLGRDKKKTMIVVISMSLSLVLLNSVYSVSNGFDLDKYLSKFVKTDFLIGNTNYFNVLNGFHSEADALSERFINAVSSQEGFKGGGRLYYNLGKSIIQYPGDTSGLLNPSLGENQDLQLSGLEDFPLSQLNIVEGKLDLDKFKTGQYIIEGLMDDDNGNIQWNEDHYSIGDKVTITTGSSTYEYLIMAKCRMGYTNHVRYWGDFGFYLPATEFSSIVPDATVMSYQFNVDDAHTAVMEEFVKNYTENIEPAMDYESKQSYTGEFKKMQNMLLTVGGALCVIIGLIGILNFINSMLTSIIARRREFAMLQSIGMTGKQLHKLLIYEGLFYALATIALSFAFGILFSFIIIRGVVSSLWFFSYKFVIAPLLISYPILLILSAVIPYAVYHGVNRQSIIERLREVE